MVQVIIIHCINCIKLPVNGWCLLNSDLLTIWKWIVFCSLFLAKKPCKSIFTINDLLFQHSTQIPTTDSCSWHTVWFNNTNSSSFLPFGLFSIFLSLTLLLFSLQVHSLQWKCGKSDEVATQHISDYIKPLGKGI